MATIQVSASEAVATANARPDLIQMDVQQDDAAVDVNNTTAAATAEHLERLQRDAQASNICGLSPFDLAICVLSAAMVVAYLIFMMQGASHRSEYMSLACLMVPNLVFAYMIVTRHRPEDGRPLPIAGMVGRFAVGFVVLLPLIFLVGVLLLVIVTFLATIFHPGTPSKDAIRSLVVILTVVISEELVKLLIFAFKDRRSDFTASRPEFYIYFGTSTAMGLASAEIFIIMRELIKIMQSTAEEEMARDHDKVPLFMVFSLLVVLTAMMMPMQLLASYYVGLACARMQETKRVAVIFFPLLIAITWRVMFLVVIFVVMLPYNFLLGVGVDVLVALAFFWIVIRYQNSMPAEYLRKTGSIQFGFSVLPMDEEGARQDEQQHAEATATGGGRIQVGGPGTGAMDEDAENNSHDNNNQGTAGRGECGDGRTDVTKTEVPATAAAIAASMSQIQASDLALSPAQSSDDDAR